MASDMILYWGSGSGPCWRPMICLEEKGLSDYTSKLISFDNKEHKSDEVLKINPRGEVPAFKHGNVIVNESLAICLYLESTFKAQGTKLVPDDPAQQALVLQRAVESQNFRDNAAYGVLSYFMRTKPEDRTEAMLEEKKKTCFEELQLWEGYLAKLGDGSHIAGKNFTLADACTFPYVATLVRMGFNMSRYPHLAKYYDQVKDRPSVKASWPPHWKDTPNKDVLKDI